MVNTIVLFVLLSQQKSHQVPFVSKHPFDCLHYFLQVTGPEPRSKIVLVTILIRGLNLLPWQSTEFRIWVLY